MANENVAFFAQRGHKCKHLHRWVHAGEEVQIPADLAARRVRHNIGVLVEEGSPPTPEEDTLQVDEGTGLTDANFDSIAAYEKAVVAIREGRARIEDFEDVDGSGAEDGLLTSDVDDILAGLVVS